MKKYFKRKKLIKIRKNINILYRYIDYDFCSYFYDIPRNKKVVQNYLLNNLTENLWFNPKIDPVLFWTDRGYPVKKIIKKSFTSFFSPEQYLLLYEDVRISGINPLWHFLKHGINERRWFNLLIPTYLGINNLDTLGLNKLREIFNENSNKDIEISPILQKRSNFFILLETKLDKNEFMELISQKNNNSSTETYRGLSNVLSRVKFHLRNNIKNKKVVKEATVLNYISLLTRYLMGSPLNEVSPDFRVSLLLSDKEFDLSPYPVDIRRYLFKEFVKNELALKEILDVYTLLDLQKFKYKEILTYSDIKKVKKYLIYVESNNLDTMLESSLNVIETFYKIGFGIILVTNNSNLNYSNIKGLVAVIEKPLFGRDILGYLSGLEFLKEGKKVFDRVVFLNDSVVLDNDLTNKLKNFIEKKEDLVGYSESYQDGSMHYQTYLFSLSFSGANQLQQIWLHKINRIWNFTRSVLVEEFELSILKNLREKGLTTTSLYELDFITEEIKKDRDKIIESNYPLLNDYNERELENFNPVFNFGSILHSEYGSFLFKKDLLNYIIENRYIFSNLIANVPNEITNAYLKENFLKEDSLNKSKNKILIGKILKHDLYCNICRLNDLNDSIKYRIGKISLIEFLTESNNIKIFNENINSILDKALCPNLKEELKGTG